MALSAKLHFAFLFVLMLTMFGLPPTRGHPSCCKHKLGLEQTQSAFIDDLNDSPPAFWQGQPQYIDDLNDTKPEDWDDEDDGDWAPVRILNPEYTWRPRQIPNPDYIPPPSYWDKLRVELSAAMPWVTLGVLITGILSLIPLPLETLKWWLQPSIDDCSNGILALAGRVSRLLSAALLGLATPLCSCGALPLCAALLKQGVPFSSALAFLTASQSSGLDSAAITYGLLGAPAMIGRLGGAMVLALAVGLACPFDSGSTRRKSQPIKTAMDACNLVPPSSGTNNVAGVISTCLETATEIYPTVLIGLVLSTAVLHHLPSLTFILSPHVDGLDATGVTTKNDLWMRLLLLGSAVPLQLCEHTAVTLASTIQKVGGSPGLAFAFLLSAPATNLPSILWMWNSGYTFRVIPILLSLSGTALLLSFLVDASQLDLLAGEETGDMAQLPGWLVKSSPYIAGTMLSAGWIQKYLIARPKASDGHGACCSASDKAKTD